MGKLFGLDAFLQYILLFRSKNTINEAQCNNIWFVALDTRKKLKRLEFLKAMKNYAGRLGKAFVLFIRSLCTSSIIYKRDICRSFTQSKLLLAGLSKKSQRNINFIYETEEYVFSKQNRSYTDIFNR